MSGQAKTMKSHGDPELDELFRRCTLPLGGPFSMSRLNRLGREAISLCAPAIELCRNEGIYVGFIANEREVNATAFTHEGREFIGINAAVLGYLVTAAVAVAKVIRLDRPGKIIDRKMYFIAKGHFQGSPLATRPFSFRMTSEQRELYRMIVGSGMQYVIMHELAHFHSGHIAYFEARRPGEAAQLYETSAGVEDKSNLLTAEERRAMEIDADMDAIELVLDDLDRTVLFGEAGETERFGVPVKYIALELALGVLFLELAMSNDHYKAHRGHHPHPLVREALARLAFPIYFNNTDRAVLANQVETWFAHKSHFEMIFEIYYMFKGPYFASRGYLENGLEEWIRTEVIGSWAASAPYWEKFKACSQSRLQRLAAGKSARTRV